MAFLPGCNVASNVSTVAVETLLRLSVSVGLERLRTGMRALAGSWRQDTSAAVLDIVNFELLDQMAEFRRSLHQLLGGFLGVRCASRRALRRLCHARDVAGDFSAAVRRFAYIVRHLVCR